VKTPSSIRIVWTAKRGPGKRARTFSADPQNPFNDRLKAANLAALARRKGRDVTVTEFYTDGSHFVFEIA
jgi:hypothetical protein